MTNPDDVQDEFYEEGDFLISSISKSDKRPILSLLTSMPELDVTMSQGRVSPSHTVPGNAMGDTGLLLLQSCSSYDSTITNTTDVPSSQLP